MTLEAFLAQLGTHTGPNAKGWYSARCRGHEDREASLGIRAGDRGIILKCQAGCTAEAIVTAMGLRLRDLFGDDQAGRPCTRVGAYSIPPRTGATVQPGLTLAQYAAAKQLPVDFSARSGCRTPSSDSTSCASRIRAKAVTRRRSASASPWTVPSASSGRPGPHRASTAWTVLPRHAPPTKSCWSRARATARHSGTTSSSRSGSRAPRAGARSGPARSTASAAST
jgi:hypothetical protein